MFINERARVACAVKTLAYITPHLVVTSTTSNGCAANTSQSCFSTMLRRSHMNRANLESHSYIANQGLTRFMATSPRCRLLLTLATNCTNCGKAEKCQLCLTTFSLLSNPMSKSIGFESPKFNHLVQTDCTLLRKPTVRVVHYFLVTARLQEPRARVSSFCFLM